MIYSVHYSILSALGPHESIRSALGPHESIRSALGPHESIRFIQVAYGDPSIRLRVARAHTDIY